MRKNVATATNVAGVITVVYLHAGIDYPEVGAVVQGGASITVANTTVAGGANFPVARFAIAAGVLDDPRRRGLALPGNASTADDMIGITERPHGKIENSRSTLSTAVEQWPIGESVDVVYEGPIEMVNNGTVAALAGGLVHVVRNTAGGDVLGEARSDADGGNTVVMPRSTYWRDPTPVGERGLIFVRT